MKLQAVVLWHRILGMVATAFIVVLSITGILLLHTDGLNLQDRLVGNSFLLSWYKIEPELGPRTFIAGTMFVTQIDDQVYFEERKLSSGNEVLKGMVRVEEMYLLAYDNSIDLLTGNGELIERLTALQGIPQGIESIGTGPEGNAFIKTRDGHFTPNTDLNAWQSTPQISINWSIPVDAPEQHTAKLLQLYRGQGLPMERVIQDLHSGRILGQFGIWMVDIVVVIFLALAVSGWWGWIKRRAQQKEVEDEL